MTYPDEPHDSESLFVDPSSGDLYLFAKENLGPASLYVARAPLADGETRVLEAVGSVDPNGSITGADARELELVIRTYSGMLYVTRSAGESWGDALMRAPTRLPCVIRKADSTDLPDPGRPRIRVWPLVGSFSGAPCS